MANENEHEPPEGVVDTLAAWRGNATPTTAETTAEAKEQDGSHALHLDVTPTSKKRLTSADFRKARKYKTQDVFVPELDGFVMMKSLTGKERDAFESSLRVKKNGKDVVDATNMRAKLVVLCAIDETGNRVWGDADAAWLGDSMSSVISLLYNAASKLSGFTLEDTDELEGNSKGGPGGGSK